MNKPYEPVDIIAIEVWANKTLREELLAQLARIKERYPHSCETIGDAVYIALLHGIEKLIVEIDTEGKE